ncbi:Cys-tRNA(Pro) deacylase [Fervidibacillus halotolerans]|uniref:Cys-tRNA(Pro)/Cys-tRNA(Cys) deacylase n=1 Tax=Fervidibacillus halotolerans TaxID=2980027 RepID=A0A9E8RZH5_9BACI|nr:Cys-tRNA(Pro) deacylase [Fervidibacillus halotolerans]WAA13353.1 Cys-tRNA(Pro) deacylase [Fervidibacillus halotolerans]
MGKVKKTNAMRMLDQAKIEYNVYTYESTDYQIDGISVAKKIGKDGNVVFKTLVAQGESKEIYVFVIPVNHELHLKLAAKAAGEKNIHLIPAKDLKKWTGYIRGGCSPIGMKKPYKTYIDESANNLDKIIVSAGKIGMQIELSLEDLLKMTDGTVTKLIQS